MEDLWPQDIAEPGEESPVAILRYQAEAFSERFQYQLEEVVKPIERPGITSRFWDLVQWAEIPHDFAWAFSIVAPTLGNYRYQLFEIFFGIDVYPVHFLVHGSVARSLGDEWLPRQRLETVYADALKALPEAYLSEETESVSLVAPDKDGFLAILKALLRSPRTRSVVQALLAQLPDQGPAVIETW